jgi:P pilus assembly chaperone PapD
MTGRSAGREPAVDGRQGAGHGPGPRAAGPERCGRGREAAGLLRGLLALLLLPLPGALGAGAVPPAPSSGPAAPAGTAAAPAQATARAVTLQPATNALMISPTRLVFEQRMRAADLLLINPGDVRTSYRIALIGAEMDLDGAVREVPLVPGPDGVDLAAMIRYSPKRVALEPRQAQTVRIQLRKPADLPDGEYRLHLRFQEEPPPPPEPGTGGRGEEPKGVSMTISTLNALTIPLIVRQGETSARVAITGLALDGPRRVLRLRLERTGNRSVYGDLEVTLQPPSGPVQVLARRNGVAVYRSNPFRNLVLPLEPAAPAGKAGGRLEVRFTEAGAGKAGPSVRASLDLD